MTPPRHRILIVSYAYPRPDGGWGSVVGSERMLQFAKHLPAHQIEVRILTHRGRVPLTAAGANVLAALDIMRWTAEAASSLRRSLRGEALAGEVPGRRAGPREGWGISDLRTRARRWILPDRASFAWAPAAIAAAAQRFAHEPPQLVLSSSPPFAAHVVGCALAAHFGVPWIADVRDGYGFEAPEGASPVGGARRWLERQLYARAALLVSVTDALRDEFRSFLPLSAANVITLSNGFDAALFEGPAAARAEHEPWTVLYAGSTQFRSGLDLANLLCGVDRFAGHMPGGVRVRLMGLFSAQEIPPLQQAKLELTGWRPRAEVAQSMRQADVLVVLTGNHPSVATTKLFEYIGAARPILVVGRQSAAARIVLEHQLGLVTDDDPASIARTLGALHAERETWQARLMSEAAQRARRTFSRQEQAAVLALRIRQLLDTHQPE